MGWIIHKSVKMSHQNPNVSNILESPVSRFLFYFFCFFLQISKLQKSGCCLGVSWRNNLQTYQVILPTPHPLYPCIFIINLKQTFWALRKNPVKRELKVIAWSWQTSCKYFSSCSRLSSTCTGVKESSFLGGNLAVILGPNALRSYGTIIGID